MIQMNLHSPNLYLKNISYCERDCTYILINNNQFKNNHDHFTIKRKLGHDSDQVFLVTKYFSVTRFLEIETPPFAQKEIMYIQKMVEKLGHKNKNLVAMMTKFPSIRPSFIVLGNLVIIRSFPTV